MGCKNQAQRKENDARGGRPYQVEASCNLYRQVVTRESQHDFKDRRPRQRRSQSRCQTCQHWTPLGSTRAGPTNAASELTVTVDQQQQQQK
jgi:hypothetical protein